MSLRIRYRMWVWFVLCVVIAGFVWIMSDLEMRVQLSLIDFSVRQVSSRVSVGAKGKEVVGSQETTALSAYLVQSGFASPDVPPRFANVSVSYWYSDGGKGEAYGVYDMLYNHPSNMAPTDARGQYWVEWSEQHPAIAHRFWPIVLDLGYNREFGKAKGLLILAMKSNSDPGAVELELDRLSSDADQTKNQQTPTAAKNR